MEVITGYQQWPVFNTAFRQYLKMPFLVQLQSHRNEINKLLIMFKSAADMSE